MKSFLKHSYNIEEKIFEMVIKAENDVCDQIKNINKVSEYNQYKVLYAMQKNKLSDSHFCGTSGYGYNDSGRDVIDKIYADIFKSEDALVRHNFISGTHALSTALFGILRPGDTLLAVTGKPYDTLEEVIGIRGEGSGSLKDFGINYIQCNLLKDGTVDYEKLKKSIYSSTKIAFIQRSRGYNWRTSLTIDEMEKLIKVIKDIKNDIVVMVDNCYGEFVETKEPTEVGADICVGSLIKNPGGGLALTGGYIAGRKELIEKISYRLTSPGIGKECGASLGFNRSILQGLFIAPHIVGESLKGAVLASRFFELLGFEVSPKHNEKRSDIIQAIKFNDKEKLIAFCKAIQAAAPVDSYASPEPWDMPGYENQVIMAAGTFTQGSSIELSADAPIKEPYIGYMQGGMTYEHIKLAIMMAAQNMINKSLL